MLTRRDLLKMGLLAGGSAMLPLEQALGRNLLRLPGGGNGGSPATTPFLRSLPLPATVQPVAAFSTRCATPGGTVFYEIHEKEGLHSFHPDLPPATVWGYQDVNAPNAPLTPGPTFIGRVNVPAVARFVNDLPTAPRSFGVPNTTVHRHGGFQEDLSDGIPTLFFRPGESYDYCWPNSNPDNDPREGESTLWYHDHLVDFTAQNVYRGLAGFHLMFDDVDSGNENDPNPNALRLPSGDFDVPMVVQDKLFAGNGELVYDSFSHNGFLGDKFCVNGAIQPFFSVKQRKYRFRFLNGSNARFFEFFLSNGRSFVQIGADDNLLPHPITRTSIRIAPAERIDVVLDFNGIPTGTAIFLENRLQQTSGRGPDRVVSHGTQVLKFIVDGPAADPSQVPNNLRELPPINPGAVTVQRRFEFARSHGGWVVNGEFFDPNRVLARPRLGVPEIWTLKNGGGGWFHPIHIHLESHRILTRNGRIPPAWEQGRKDTVVLNPSEEVRIYIEFRQFAGQYVFHCHNIEHEDVAMMGRFDTIL
ncbi:MAG: multicopper oxidase domain-containing protein [Planctomycetes bacterium]|nr:multicopper oxidase domain-containing protein [Planctomycetota bacterium]MBI3847339.1 multicopper oxidase domain-containing protein [Planctomycetota bacterium]